MCTLSGKNDVPEQNTSIHNYLCIGVRFFMALVVYSVVRGVMISRSLIGG
jgi:hypothetical protein